MRIVSERLVPMLGALRQRVAVNPLRIGWQRGRLLKNGTLNEEQLEPLRRVSLRIHHRDDMYEGDAAKYLTVGLSAIECIDEVLAQVTTAPPIKNVLDLPSGYGRELRFLVNRFPEAAITACDIQWEGVDFCKDVLGALPSYSRPNLKEMSFERGFDLIWSGSLVTHLNRARTLELFKLFVRHLNTDGVVVVTTHGDFEVERMLAGDKCNLPSDVIAQLVQSYADTGYAYADYAHEEDAEFHTTSGGYGVSVTSPETIRAIAKEVGNLEEVYFKPRRWANHQDVFAFQRV